MKKTLSFVLSFFMLFSLLPVANAAVNEDYQMRVDGTSGNLYAGTDGITFEMQMKGPEIGGTASVILKIDATKLQFVTPAARTAGNVVAITETVGLTTLKHPAGYGNLYKTKADWVTNVTFLGGTTADGNTIYLAIQPEFASEKLPTHADNLTSAASFCLGFKSGVTADDIDANTIKTLTVEDVTNINQSEGAIITDGAGFELNYNPTVVSGKENNLKQPEIFLNGAALPAGSTPLNSIKVTLNKSTVAVPTAGKTDTTVVATAAVGDDSVGATLPSDIKYSIVETSHTGVNVNANTGVITVEPSAAAGTYTVKAASASKSKEATAQFTLTKDAPAVTTVTLSPTSGTATLKAAGGADAITVGVTVKDQYGAEMDGQTATISGQPTGVTYTGGKLTFDNTARATTGAQNVTFTVGTKTATFALTIKKGAQTAAPTTPTGVKTTTVGGNDGKITGVTADMEYSSNGTNWTKCTGTEVTGLAKGTYKVRYAATDYLDASPAKDVTIGEPGKTDTPTVTIASTPAAANGTVTIAEDGSATLTATVTPATGTIHYQWKKGATNVGTDAATLTVAAADAGEYTCVVTREAPGESVSDPATSNKITVEVKTKTPVTVTKKADQTNFKTGAVSSIALTDIATVDPAAAASKLTATIVAYEKVVTPGTPAKDAVPCNCSKSSEDPTTATHDEGCTYQPAVPATPDTVAYNPVTTLANSKTYFLGYSIAALTDDTYSYAGVSAPSAPAVEADEANFVKVTTRAASSGGGGGSSTTKYTVTYDAGEHGKLDGSATERVESGKTPTKVPSVVADKGYKFVGWTLNGKSVKPASTKITAATKFVAEYETADKVTYIQGMDKNHFQPAGNATRGQLATMLARLSKDYDASKTYTGKAPDVENGKWYTNTVNFAINQGIMNGFEDGMFRPTENIRRGEFAAMLARYLGLNTSSKAHFADVTDHWAAGYINALADAGIVDGFEDGTFKAQNLLTRAEAVKMINLAVEMKYDEKADYDNSFVDVAEGAWYYEYVMPAANLDVTDYQR